MSPAGLGLCLVFWLAMFKAVQMASGALFGTRYSSLPKLVKADWDNFAWSASHGIIGFIVRRSGGGLAFVCVWGGGGGGGCGDSWNTPGGQSFR
jgi:hypothetical protein